MTVIDMLVLLAVLATGSVRWLPPAARPRAAALAGLVVVGSLVVEVVQGGLRWQLVPVVAAFGAATWLARQGLRRSTPTAAPRRLGTVLLAVVVAGGVVLGAALLWGFPALRLPAPSGSAPVGTMVLEWVDPSRPEVSGPAPERGRTVVAQLWYPADVSPGTERSVYLGRDRGEARQVAAGVAATFGLPSFLLDEAARARTSATPDAPPQAGEERFPVVVFSPGLSGVRTQNTAWAEDLASHGYVVVALDHPYDSALVVLDDGTAVASEVAATGDADEDERLADGWTQVRADDLRFALTQLELIDQAAVPNVLAGRMDTDHAAVAGHSLGGAAAIRAAAADARFDAVIDIDGFPRHLPTVPLEQPVLALVAGTGTGSPESDAQYAARLDELMALSAAGGWILTLPGAGHLTFTDAALFLPPVPTLTGTLPRDEGPRITASATRVFLDASLRGRDVDVSGALDPLGDLTVH